MGKVNIRDKSGKLYSLNGALFLELCSGDGKLQAIMHIDDGPMTKVKIAYPGDAEFARYKKIFGKEEGKLIGVNLSWADRKKLKWQAEA